MIVKCIDGDFTSYDQPEVVKNILLVGDDDLLPKEGREYELAGIDTHNYGARLVFNIDRFIVIDDTFVPNSYDKNMNMPCNDKNIYISFDENSAIAKLLKNY
jgi:hypothetical protein